MPIAVTTAAHTFTEIWLSLREIPAPTWLMLAAGGITLAACVKNGRD